MKNIKSSIKVMLSLSLLCVSHASFGVGCRISQTGAAPLIVAAGDMTDSQGNQIIQAKIGTLDVDPSLWQLTTLSASLSASFNQGTRVYKNNNGDVVVLWSYIDQYYNNQVAAALLVDDGPTWHVANISQSLGSAYTDYEAHVDENGDIMAVWTAYDTISGNNVVVGATVQVATSTVWSNPFVILKQ